MCLRQSSLIRALFDFRLDKGVVFGFVALPFVVLLVACTGQAPQEEYDQVVAERDQARAEVAQGKNRIRALTGGSEWFTDDSR